MARSYIYFQGLYWWNISIDIFFFKLELHGAQSCWFTLLQRRTEKSWFMTVYACVTYAGFLCVIKHREFQTKWQRSQTCFHNFQISLLNNLYHKLAKNLRWILLLSLFCSAACNTNRSCDASLSVASLNFSRSVTLRAIIIIMNT